MAISLASLNTKARIKPPRILLSGVAGVGKTTLAAGAPNPVFLWLEDGRGRLDVPGWPEEGVLGSYAEVIDALGVLYAEEHDRKTLVIDSLDWLEYIVHAETCRRHGVSSIEQVGGGYGKGFREADSVWGELIGGMTALRDDRDIGIILIAHVITKKYDNPESEAYDRFKIKLQDRAEGRLTEYCDIACFMNYRVSVIKDDPANKNSRKRAVGNSNRVAYFEERPAFIAKNRYGLPPSVDLPTTSNAWETPSVVWDAIAQHIPYYRAAAEAKTEQRAATPTPIKRGARAQ